MMGGQSMPPDNPREPSIGRYPGNPSSYEKGFLKGQEDMNKRWQEYHEWYIKEKCVGKEDIKLAPQKVKQVLQNKLEELRRRSFVVPLPPELVDELAQAIVEGDVVEVRKEGR